MSTLARPFAVVVATAAIAAVLGLGNPAEAGLTTVNIVSDKNQKDATTKGKFGGQITYDSDAARLTVTLDNLNTAKEGGFITALAFNNPGDKITKAALFSTTNANFKLYGTGQEIKGKGKNAPPTIVGNNSVAASPYANFDFLLGLGSSFQGSGSPNGGIGAGSSATFVIDLTGTGLSGLTASSFLSAYNNSPTENVALLARFKGFADEGSDKVTGVEKVVGPTAPVPEPSLMAMGAAGLAGLGLVRRRFGRTPASA